MDFPGEWSKDDDLEVIRILRDHAAQMRLKGSAATAATAGKMESLLSKILTSATSSPSGHRASPQTPHHRAEKPPSA